MKKRIGLAVLLTLLWCPLISLKAVEVNFQLKPQKMEVLQTEQIQLEFILNTKEEVTEGTFNIMSNSPFMNLVSVNSKIATVTEKNNKITFKANKSIAKGEVAVTIIYETLVTAPKNLVASINVSNIFVTLKNKEEKQVPNLSSMITITSKKTTVMENSLKTLTSTDVEIPFEPNTLEYNVTVKSNVKKLNIEAVPENEEAAVEISSQLLQEGANEILITVTPTIGDVKLYKIKVIREKEPVISTQIKKENSFKMYFLLLVSIIVVVLDITYLIRKK